MLEAVESRGEWWLPDKPDAKVPGQMIFHPSEGVSLELQGSLAMTGAKSDVILGVSTEPKEITLSNCVETGSRETYGTSSTSGKGISSRTSHIHAQVAFVGGHFASEREFLFKKISVSYTHLDEWANLSGLSPNRDKGKVGISFAPPESLQATVDDNRTITLGFGANSEYSRTSYSIRQHASLVLESKNAEHFRQFRKLMDCMQGLLTLLMSEPVFPTKVEAYVSVPESKEGEEKHSRGILVHLPSSFAETANERIHSFHMPAPLSEIKPHFGDFIRNWWGKFESLNHIQTLYYGTLCNPYLYLDNRFLSMVQAVESYHRLTMRNYVGDKSAYDAKVSEIIDSVDKKHRKWLKYLMKWGNEPILADRLDDTFNKYFEGMDEFLDYGHDAVKRIVDTRNYLTHYSPDLKERRAQGPELYYLTQILKKALEIALLTEVGFDIDDARKRAGKSGEYRNLQAYKSHLHSNHRQTAHES